MNKLNRLYTKYKYSHYCHDDNNNIFRNLHSISNYGEYFMVQALYNNNHKTNINIYYKYLDNRIFYLLPVNDIVNKMIIYINYQRFIYAMRKFVLILRLKIKKKYNKENLLFYPLKKNYISLIENNIVYNFDDFEIYKLCKSCFSYTEFNIPKILDIKNPYTNNKFSIHNLYNIYFYLQNYNIPTLFFLYFKEGFNKRVLLKKYKLNIIIEGIEQKFNEFSESRKTDYIKIMLELNYEQQSILNLSDKKLYTLFYRCCKHFYIYYRLIDYTQTPIIPYHIKYYYQNKFLNRLHDIEKKAPLLGRTIWCSINKTRTFMDEISHL